MKRSKMLKFLEAFTNAKINRIPFSKLYSENLIVDNFLGRITGRENYQKTFPAWSKAFPDWYVETKKIRIDGNIAVVSYEYKGTYSHPYKAPLIDLGGDSPVPEKLRLAPLGRKIAGLCSECTYVFDEESVTRMHIHSDYKMFYEQLEINSILATKKDKDELIKEFQSRYKLSKREIHCVALTLLGFSAKNLASLFFISFRTVETHLQHAYIKLNCSGKQHCFEKMLSNETLHLWHDLGDTLLRTVYTPSLSISRQPRSISSP